MKKRTELYANYVRLSTWVLERAALPLVYRKKRGLTAENDLNYFKGSRNCVCDFYYKDKKEKKPVLIYIHGGGFICGGKNLRRYYCYEYADEGFFVMNLNYDYAPKCRYPIQLQRLFKAFELLYEKEEEYNLDLSGVFLAGESAGAYFCSLIGAISRKPELYETFSIDFAQKNKFFVKALVLMNGAYDAEELCKIRFLNMKAFLQCFFDVDYKKLKRGELHDFVCDKSPLPYIDADFPPTVVGRGENDGLDSESVRLIEILRKNRVPYCTFTAKGIVGFHACCIAAKFKEGRRCLALTLDFIKKYL